MQGLKKLLPLALLSLSLGGCVTTMGTGATKVASEGVRPQAVCIIWRPISWSRADTDQTIREAKANNRAREAWGCPS